MEVRINKDISEYSEHMFFGLTMRQIGFAAAGIAVAVVIYFLAKPVLGLEAATWLCMLGVVPFAAMGFVRVNGMNAEQFAWAYVKTNFLMQKQLPCRPQNLYYECMKEAMEERLGILTEKEIKKRNKSRLGEKSRSQKGKSVKSRSGGGKTKRPGKEKRR